MIVGSLDWAADADADTGVGDGEGATKYRTMNHIYHKCPVYLDDQSWHVYLKMLQTHNTIDHDFAIFEKQLLKVLGGETVANIHTDIVDRLVTWNRIYLGQVKDKQGDGEDDDWGYPEYLKF